MAYAKPPFAHTPYASNKAPFSPGLEPITPDIWLEPDGNLSAYLQRKNELLTNAYDDVVRAEQDTLEAQEECAALILDHLEAHHADQYERVGDRLIPKGMKPTDFETSSDEPPLVTTARLVQEDLVLMRKGKDQYFLAAACLCFPSSWSLAEKFGKSMFDIHEPVPGFNNARLGKVVDRIFANLQVDQLIARYNWSIYDDPDLHHPHSRQIEPQLSADASDALANIFIRVERQTLKRLPKTGDILFTIKIHQDPISWLSKQANGPELATGLRKQLLELDPDQLAYKGLTRHRDLIANTLQSLAGDLVEP